MKWTTLLALAAVFSFANFASAGGYHGHSYQHGHAYGGSVIGSRPHYGWHSSHDHSQSSYSPAYSYMPAYQNTSVPAANNHSVYDQSNYGSRSAGRFYTDFSR